MVQKIENKNIELNFFHFLINRCFEHFSKGKELILDWIQLFYLYIVKIIDEFFHKKVYSLFSHST